MKKFLIQIILFLAFFTFVFIYFENAGSFQVVVFDYDIETTVSLAAVLILVFAIIISYLSFLLRLIVSLPGLIAAFCTDLKEKKAREVLFEILSLKEGGIKDAAVTVFQKYGKQLINKNYDVAKILDYKFCRNTLNEAVLLKKYIQLSSCVGGGEIILYDFILQKFKAGNITEIERFSQEISRNKKSGQTYLLTQIYLALSKGDHEASLKFLDKLSDSYLSRKTYANIKANILCTKATFLIQKKLFSKAEKTLLEALSIEPTLHKIFETANMLPKKNFTKSKYKSILDKKWSEYPSSELITSYLQINDDVSKGVLDLLESLLKLNDADQAKLVIGTEYLIYGYKKESEVILSQLDSLYKKECCFLERAMIFRAALASEKKPEKLKKFRELIFGSYGS